MSSKRVGLRPVDRNIITKKITPSTQFKSKPLEPTSCQLENTPTRQQSTQSTQKKGNKVKLERPVMKPERKKIMLDLFQDDDTPIRKLPFDCLLMIFRYCPLATLLSLASVNRNWRKIAQTPSLWTDLTVPWFAFYQSTTSLKHTPKPSLRFQHVRVLTINVNSEMIMESYTHYIKYSPFGQVETLNTINMPLRYIQYVTVWTPNIISLNCQDIPVEAKESMVMPKFKGLDKLDSLRLKFAQPYRLEISPFLNRFGQDICPDVFPSTLSTLELTNLTDDEEGIYSDQAIDYLIRLRQRGNDTTDSIQYFVNHAEVEAAKKYSIFSSLNNLTSLSLDRLSRYTTIAWSEYMQSCSKKLTYISLKGYKGRIKTLDMAIPEDYGLSVFIASLCNIETIFLDDFLCTPDLILGLKKLTESDKIYHIENTIENATDINDYLDKQLHNFSISIKKIKNEVMTV
ncbi:uncharacterized protein EV154DRAFT_520347 [Mucor mucedo]|uniref:uncharacterized protein n=1 Tax=Mucor mucedo TaxID=29922 RepID=UPI00221E3FF3|nr:uncharacterized protein EV154DRAFT_520347 [Mucor mucedo]KAI7887655.1 hypothetical protein EV154DRAFT_520347 [Mucor mucedo]